jgi:hypothetical protein
MTASLVFALALAPGGDPTGPKTYPPVYVPAEAPHGYLYAPATDLQPLPRSQAVPYTPKAGDVVLMSDPDPLFFILHRIARTGVPGHSAVVVTMPDGRLGLLESGFSFSPWTRINPLDYALNLYKGHLWIRPRTTPLTPEQDRRLTEFALLAEGKKYNLMKYARQLTFFRARNPVVTRFAGKPVGAGQEYICVQVVIEALVYCGVVDAETARPSATYAQDMFYDRSRNPYIDRHPPLGGGGWGEPQLWTPIPGTALRGRDRPQPPSPWPGAGGANLIHPIPNGDGQPPTPTVVGYLPPEPYPIQAVKDAPQRIGFFDRPYRLFGRRK